jgi:hypothetical protein
VGVFYTTRETVKAALDIKETARSDAQVDRAIESASRMIDGGDQIGGLLKRRFYPEIDTRYFDWPNAQTSRVWRLWLDQHEIISVTTLSSGGTTIAASDYFLRPDYGPPYTHLELDLASSATFGGGSTHQRDITITGVFGSSNTEVAAGTTVEALDSSETGVDISDSTLIGVGDLIKVDDERMLVTGKVMLDTAVNIDAGDSLTASAADVSITMSTTTAAPVVGEVILIGSERMLVVDVASTVLTVKRAWDGSVLATHAGSADIYAPRTLTVTRAYAGTTAASHSTSAAIVRNQPPGMVQALCVAEALNLLGQEQAGYAYTAGTGQALTTGSRSALQDLRSQAKAAHGRNVRLRGV